MKKAVIAANLAVLALIWACEEPEPPKISVGPGADETGQDASSPDVDPDGGMQAEPSTPIVPTRNLSKFDPDEVYLFGTLSEGACYRDAIAPVLQPNLAVVGFDCYASPLNIVIRPSDGAMLYTNTFEDLLRVFHCDGGCRYFVSRDTYPSMPDANDDILPTPPCDPDSNRLVAFRVSLDGDVVHQCANGIWHDAEGNNLTTGREEIFVAGTNGNVLRDDGIQNLASGTLSPVTGLPDGKPLAVRAQEDGFWVVVPGSGAANEPELWHVNFDGISTLVGAYPPPPAGLLASSTGGPYLPQPTVVLGGSGDLWQMAQDQANPLGDAIIRRGIDGVSEVAYHEKEDPFVKIHGSSLLTGP